MFRLASRRGDLTRLPVATDLLDGAHSLPATSMPRRLLSARLGISDVSRTPSCADVFNIREVERPGESGAGFLQRILRSGLRGLGKIVRRLRFIRPNLALRHRFALTELVWLLALACSVPMALR